MEENASQLKFLRNSAGLQPGEKIADESTATQAVLNQMNQRINSMSGIRHPGNRELQKESKGKNAELGKLIGRIYLKASTRPGSNRHAF